MKEQDAIEEQIREILGRRGMRSVLAHVDPALLTEYAERPEELEPETRRWIEQKLEECETCREAHALLREVASSLEPKQERFRPLAWLRDRLGATVLRPAPALAYLVALMVLVPYLLVRERSIDAPFVTAPVLALRSEPTVRDEGGDASPPLEIASPQGDRGTVVLLLETDLVEADLREGRMKLALELRRGDEVLESREVGARDFEFRDGRGVLPLVLRTKTLQEASDLEVSVRALLPGDPLDGQPLFRRHLRVTGER